MIRYYGLLIASRWLGTLPESVLEVLSIVFGVLAYHLNVAGRRAVLSNLRRIAPLARGAERRRIGKAIFINATRFYFEFLRIPHIDLASYLRTRVDFVGIERLMAFKANKNGVVLVSVHYGSPELAFHLVHHLGIPAFALTEPLRPEVFSRLVHRLRNCNGRLFQPVSIETMKRAVRALRRGAVVAIMVDRDVQGTGICVERFGDLARAPVGAVDLAIRTGATIVPVLTERLTGSRLRVEIGEPFPLDLSGNREETLRKNVEGLLAVFEPDIRRDPTQWLVLQPLWGDCVESNEKVGVT